MSGLLASRKIVLIGIAIFVALIIWYGFMRSNEPAPLLTSDDVVETEGQADSDVVASLLALRAISLAGTIFEDPAFRRLQDFGNEVTPEPVGRSNPFAPLGADGAASTSTSTSTPRR